MKREIKLIIITFIGFLFLLWIAKPIRFFLIDNNLPELNSRFIAGIFMRLSIIVLAIKLINIKKIKNYNGLSTSKRVNNIQALAIPFVFILSGIISNWYTYTNTQIYLLLLFILSVFTVGFAEEIVFRGIILPLFIKHFKAKKNVLFISVLCTSLIFGGLHFFNILKEPGNIVGITNQVFFATSISFFFGGLMLRTNNIIIPSIIHGFINLAFGSGILNQKSAPIITGKISEGINWSSIIPTTIFFSFIFLGGAYMIKKVNKSDILKELNI
ncbi:CPBP family intramembrane glutamic endopeptidase [Polaribacter porphyrae]|uniref:CAAX prenyl protease 2/Lysostaphin resistance protein A-like domain-containing protein n=1 Tax=Polaribacter porphyrae TaxID=1137780 RepID=A0A2S7WP84_9FLAO|nr:type II CAAX endopeptidase family protein [Polaribacter porphyrae]PQJ79266.1 hypothetical protein BTO18_08810 [Polaribacter porphyrae]